jgi:hypothetical protein
MAAADVAAATSGEGKKDTYSMNWRKERRTRSMGKCDTTRDLHVSE